MKAFSFGSTKAEKRVGTMKQQDEHKRGRALAAALAVLAALALPALALAIPGSGDFISLDTPAGREITELYNFLAAICAVIFVIVTTLTMAAVVRFRRKSDSEMPPQNHGNTKVEVFLLVVVTIIQIIIGVKTYQTMWYVETIPTTTMTVRAIAYQWDWKFEYPDQGGIVHEDLVFPAHTNVLLEITSEDVIHSLFIPELGVKMDAVPGRLNFWWINADGPVNQVLIEDDEQVGGAQDRLVTTRPDLLTQILNTLTFWHYEDTHVADVRGLERRVTYLGGSRRVGEVSPYEGYDAVEYRGMCTELCGKGHWDMYFRAVAMTPSSFTRWVTDKKTGGGEVDGSQIYNTKCASCHGTEGKGAPGVYPPLADSDYIQGEEGVVRHITAVLQGFDGKTAIQVNGATYQGAMQAFGPAYNDAEIAAVINHERTSWGNNYGEVTAEQVSEVRANLGLPAFPAGGAVPVPDAELLRGGEVIYRACVGCHGEQGQGITDVVPGLANNPVVLGDPAKLVSILVRGQDTEQWPGMKKPIGQPMTDAELASIVSFMRRSFGNEGELVQPETVSRIREEIMP